MFHVRQENLPFVSSHEFVGAEQGNTGVSVFLFHDKDVSRAALEGFAAYCPHSPAFTDEVDSSFS